MTTQTPVVAAPRRNKVMKGALATGVGLALLVGGGGTLATWNQSADANMGTVATGDLNLEVPEGTWQNALGQAIQIDSYKAVPGDVLTFTQDLEVTLAGDQMLANLTVTGEADASAGGGAIAVSETILTRTNGHGTPSPEDDTVDNIDPSSLLTQDDSGTYTSTTTVFFDVGTADRVATDAFVDLSGIGYQLTQSAPAF